MADKSGRSKDRGIRLTEAQLRHPGVEKAPIPEIRPSEPTAELEQEYNYVLADLRRIGLIALVMLTVLVGLALFVI